MKEAESGAVEASDAGPRAPCLAMTRRYLQPDSPAAFSLPAAASLLPRSPSLRAPPLMRNLPDRISLVALLPRQGEAVGVGGGSLVFLPCLQVTALLFSQGLCSLSQRCAERAAAAASSLLPALFFLY